MKQESMEEGLRESKLQWFVLKYFLLVLPSLLQLPLVSDAVKSLLRIFYLYVSVTLDNFLGDLRKKNQTTNSRNVRNLMLVLC